MNGTQIGIDLAKSVFEVAISHTPGRVHERHRLSRSRFRRFLAEHAPAEVLMEARSSAHYWGQELQAHGHRVALLPAADVARYRDGNKTDRADAKAVLEAARNEAIDRFPVKSVEQQGLVIPPSPPAGLPPHPHRPHQCPAWPPPRIRRHHPGRRGPGAAPRTDRPRRGAAPPVPAARAHGAP